ncbi:MAG: APC family permease [Acidobacteria bacterium]|nr:MAG: APC family permease [Acidobacteriota bacterium]PYT84659.1 MAG: APC family permease [Acidobacteriota bacterium]
MSLLDLLLGKPLASDQARAECIGVAAGIPIFGLDALSSAAYGPEAALTLLIPLGAAGIAYMIPISASIIVLLAIVYFSYRQTIQAYPGGGGSYTVARQNLGVSAGLLAAAALMIDYVLTVAVGISAGVGALVSAIPSLQSHTLTICLGILVLITLINLRGMRDAGLVFMAPTYLFVGTLLAAILIGLIKTFVSGGHPVPVEPLPRITQATALPGAWLILQAFASGCTAMTGVEAVSNGVKAFREPVVSTARRTLTVIILLLMVLLAGIAYLVRVYGIQATDPGQPGYQSVLSLLLAAVSGRGVFYYVSMASILLVLALSANTAFADFPRLCRAIAQNNYLPHSFATRGRRLVYTQGILVLAALAGVLLAIFGGVTDRLIPLYAVGAFLAFTLSQAGMVGHWRRVGGKGATRSMLINGLGAFATGITVIVVLVAKFVEGAWITVLLIPGLLLAMRLVRRHYHAVFLEVRSKTPLELTDTTPPLVILPVQGWNRIVKKALRFAFKISPNIRAIHVDCGQGSEIFRDEWCRFVEQAAMVAGLAAPELVVLPSPFRLVLAPIVDYVLEAERANPGQQIAVLVPELVERHWYHHLFHNKRASVLKALLLLRGNQRIIVINVPWYLDA